MLLADGNTGGATAAILVIVLIYLAIAAVLIWAYTNIIRRAGYSGWWVLIGLVPLVNAVMFFVFAFKEWPVSRELKQLRAWAGQGQGGYPPPGYGQQAYGQPGHEQPGYGQPYFGSNPNPPRQG